MDLLALPDVIRAVVGLAMFVTMMFALVDALRQPAEAYVAGDKLTKQAWCIILGVALAAYVLLARGEPFHLLSLAGIVAAIVYLVDVRPTLRSLTRR